MFSSLRQALEIPLLQLTQLLCKQNFQYMLSNTRPELSTWLHGTRTERPWRRQRAGKPKCTQLLIAKVPNPQSSGSDKPCSPGHLPKICKMQARTRSSMHAAGPNYGRETAGRRHRCHNMNEESTGLYLSSYICSCPEQTRTLFASSHRRKSLKDIFSSMHSILSKSTIQQTFHLPTITKGAQKYSSKD